MLHHTGILISHDLHATVVGWYEVALKPLGYKKYITEGPNDEIVGFSDTGDHADWWIIAADKTPEPKMHHAFVAKDHATVDAFHATALEAGGADNGGPGPRTQYGPNYYAAFVLDPVGHNIEVVSHASEGQT